MLNTPVLRPEQIESFERDGFLVLEQAFDADEMAHINAWTQELAALPEETGKHWVYHEKSLKGDGADLISRIENIAPFHAGFAKLSTVLKAPVAQLLDEPAALFKEKVNFKMAGGDGFKPHQDSQAGWDTYADFFISVLVSIDEATVENGCLQMCAGHHQEGLFKSWEPLSEDDMADMDFVHCPTKPGDVVFFDCFAPHASEPNMTDTTRRIFYATFNRASAGDHMAQYYADKHKSFPPDIDRDPDKEYVFRV
jgi:ectoine hydroxylase-related dioxygenase (phytanoyl-CoA dioxygenase family)